MSDNCFEMTPLPPRVDRFFPNCFVGIVECAARWRFGLRDLKKAWFSHSFVYRRMAETLRLHSNGVELDVEFFNSGEAYRAAMERTKYYYGITFRTTEYREAAPLLAAVHEAAEQRLLPISSFNLGFVRAHREFGKVFRPHMIGIVSVDPIRASMLTIDQVKGTLEVPLADYVACFEHVRGLAKPFSLTICERPPGSKERVCEAWEIKAELGRVLDALNSRDPGIGLNALRSAADDLDVAAAEIEAPFAVPGLWVFSHDRHCFRHNLAHWREARLLREDLLSELDEALHAAFDAWFEADMTIERGLRSGRSTTLELAKIVRGLISIEERTAVLLERAHAQLGAPSA